MVRRDFDGMDKAELLMAVEEVVPGLSFPEAASREDLIQYFAGIGIIGTQTRMGMIVWAWG
jgi:hypothetical protein